jgi:hypothetical protein
MTIARRSNAGGRFQTANVPQGRLKNHRVEWDNAHGSKVNFSRPFGTNSLPHRSPGDESPGYSQGIPSGFRPAPGAGGWGSVTRGGAALAPG